MKVTITLEGDPGEVAALAREITGRHGSQAHSIEDIDTAVGLSMPESVSSLIEGWVKKGML